MPVAKLMKLVKDDHELKVQARWKGWSPQHDTLEPLKNVYECVPKMLQRLLERGVSLQILSVRSAKSRKVDKTNRKEFGHWRINKESVWNYFCHIVHKAIGALSTRCKTLCHLSWYQCKSNGLPAIPEKKSLHYSGWIRNLLHPKSITNSIPIWFGKPKLKILILNTFSVFEKLVFSLLTIILSPQRSAFATFRRRAFIAMKSDECSCWIIEPISITARVFEISRFHVLFTKVPRAI